MTDHNEPTTRRSPAEAGADAVAISATVLSRRIREGRTLAQVEPQINAIRELLTRICTLLADEDPAVDPGGRWVYVDTGPEGELWRRTTDGAHRVFNRAPVDLPIEPTAEAPVDGATEAPVEVPRLTPEQAKGRWVAASRVAAAATELSNLAREALDGRVLSAARLPDAFEALDQAVALLAARRTAR